MEHSGKVAEYLVLAELIRKDVEAYSAISFRQPHYDITVVRLDRTVARVQVKATELQNGSTNNSISNLEKEYDYLVLVVFDDPVQYFILTKNEVKSEYAENQPGVIYVSQSDSGRYKVRNNLLTYEDKWEKIMGEPNA
ncbi:hypothetical protein R3F64_05645 [Halomonas sp. 5021]|uniref:hypothetical protein n=1 Tax=Halomonas sp. 5021 TaxID=3082156 RepID=UPI002FC73D30